METKKCENCVKDEELEKILYEYKEDKDNYSRFTLKPKGKYNIAVCLGTACYVKGSEKILDRLKERLGINAGETTADRKVFNRSNKMYRCLWISTSIYCKSERCMERRLCRSWIKY